MGCAQLDRHRPARFEWVRQDDRRGADRSRGHHPAQPDRAARRNQNALPGAQIQRVQHRARAGHQPAAERAEDCERHVLAHLDHIARLHHRVARKRGLAKEMAADRAMRVMQRLAAIEPRAAKVQRHEMRAIIRLSIQARVAFAACGETQDDMVALYQIGYISADRFDDPCALVAQHERQRRRNVLIAHRDVGVTQPCRDNAHQHLVGARCFELQRLDRKRS